MGEASDVRSTVFDLLQVFWEGLVQHMALALDGKAKRLDVGSEEANNDPNGYRDSRAATDSSHEGGGDEVRMDRERVHHSLGPLHAPSLHCPINGKCTWLRSNLVATRSAFLGNGIASHA